ncbi:MAG: DegT/DnrJ/EryC1/StrS family aminotransferase [Planctomycetota bacterium]
MHARLRLDLSRTDVAGALAAGLFAGNRARRARALEQRFAPGEAHVALSVRSGFDLYLEALALPEGSEVLVSGLTIPHMTQLLEAHGLCVVPFALDPRTLAPAAGELERKATARTRAVLFAHLFGARADLGPSLALARARGWLFFEDCAQAWSGDDWRGAPTSDLALFSFGLIKTATAIQGGILCVRDGRVRARMEELAARWPVQTRADFVKRAAKATALLELGRPAAFARYARHCARRGRELDDVLHAATRGFPGADWRERLQRRPGAGLLAVLARRLAQPQRSLASARRATGEALLAALGPEVEVLGRGAPERHHWVFGVGCDEPAALVSALRALGFDATARSSLVPVAPTRGGEPLAESRRLLARLVYVPLVPELAPARLVALADTIRAHARVRELFPPAPAGMVQRADG